MSGGFRGYRLPAPPITCECGTCAKCRRRELMRRERARMAELDREFDAETVRRYAESEWFGPPRTIPSSLGGTVGLSLDDSHGAAKGVAA